MLNKITARWFLINPFLVIFASGNSGRKWLPSASQDWKAH